MTTRKLVICTAALTAMLATACGGGGSSEPPPPPPPGTGGGGGGQTLGINGGGRWITLGTLSRFGSVVVNGVRYGTGTAQIFVNGQPATEADLAHGQVVRVDGNVATGGQAGEAIRVDYENSIRGRIEQVDAAARSMVVVGQFVTVRVETIFGASVSSGEIESLSSGDGIIVSGFVDSTGRLTATRIDRDPSPGTAEVLGVVSALDSAASRFRINGLTVDYGSASIDGFAGGAPANGDVVLARGPDPAGGMLVAASVSLRAGAAGGDDNLDLEGLVTRFVSTADFDVAGQPVAASASTQYVGTAPGGLAVDAFLDVEGRIDATGRLQAARIQLIPIADIEIEASIDAVDTQAGTIRMLGIDIFTNERTRYDDDDDDLFSLADLRAGDEVEIAGYVSDGRVTAVRITRDDDGGNDVEIEGPATDLADPEFRVGGIRIVTDAQTEFDDTNRADFFATAAGRRVEVEGTWTGDAVLAAEVELED